MTNFDFTIYLFSITLLCLYHLIVDHQITHTLLGKVLFTQCNSDLMIRLH